MISVEYEPDHFRWFHDFDIKTFTDFYDLDDYDDENIIRILKQEGLIIIEKELVENAEYQERRRINEIYEDLAKNIKRNPLK